ncbi:MAG: 17 kDa surface antigen [Sphingomonas bacterium]|jgi:hypothetical protein|nr:17 kDa surface antigen [Sphingomonas bacterium]
MFAKTLKIAAAVALTAATMVPAAAEARDRDHGRYSNYNGGGDYYGGQRYNGGGDYYGGQRYNGGGDYYGGQRYNGGRQRYYGNRGYASNRGYYGGRGGYRGGRCRDSGTGGTIIGAIAGGLLGHEVGQGRYNRGDGTTGAILGAGVGALAGRAIDRNC